MREVLTDSATLAKHLFNRSGDRSCPGIKFEVRMDSGHQVRSSFENGSTWRERRSRVFLELWTQGNQRRSIIILTSVAADRVIVVQAEVPDGFPSRGCACRRQRLRGNLHFAV